ncbi:MAG TPA: hypothetical protein VIT85_00990 [Solirubrobacterales bacterium]
MAEVESPTERMPALGAEGEACESCAAPLAADQRYCLNCGTRRAGPRVDYATYMRDPGTAGPAATNGTAPPAVAAEEDGAEPAKKERDYAPLAAVGGIAVLGLMLLVGVLIGKGDSDPAPAPAPVVVRGGEESGVETPAGAKAGDGSALGGQGGNGKGGAGEGGGNTAAAAGAAPATTDDLEDLNAQSGKAYEEASKNLPNKIATPGAPPPIDKSKPPGGGEGGKAVTIE